MKKGFFWILLAMTMVLLMTGCGQRTGTSGSAGAGGTASSASGDSASGVPTGYYNLAEFEQLAGRKISVYNESPMTKKLVDEGKLPPVSERLPSNPAVFKTMNGIGEYGGTLRITCINTDQDWHLRHINAGNLIELPPDPGFDAVGSVIGVPHQPGLLESYGMNNDGSVFTATIRKGLKWSDGTPVTTADVRFKIEDILLYTEVTPVAPNWLVWGGGKTEVTYVDDYTFSFKFAQPYGAFIESEVTLWPGTFQRLLVPAHYLKKYHKNYASEQDILAFMRVDGYTNIGEWRTWFATKHGLFGCDNTYMDQGHTFPTLNPWVFAEELGNGNYRLERNPYFYMVDHEGNQLPYIDMISKTYVANEEVDNMAIISGQVDLSCMTISIENFPLYRENEDRGNYYALPLPAYQDQIFICGFNNVAGVKPPNITSISGTTTVQNPAADSDYDEGLWEVYGDVRFRRAMSIALNREVFNDTLFLGMGRPAQVAPRLSSPNYEQGMEEAWAQYDPEGAKKLLDEMGMVDRNGDGWRERPDGKPFRMKYDYFVITNASTPGSELCKRYWEDVGIQVDLRLVDVTYWFDNLQSNNLNETTTWWLAGSNANLLQDWFLGPSMWSPMWNRYTQYIHSPISRDEWENKILPYVPEWQQEMQDLKMQLKAEPNQEMQIEIGTKMWRLQAEWLPMIGVVTDTPSPLILSKDIGGAEMAEEIKLNYIAVMEASECLWFKNPERRK